MNRVIIIIPCYNEADRLDCQKFKAFTCTEHEVVFLFVDDGSTDATRLLLEKLTASEPRRFVVLGLAKNCGKAEAVRRGFLSAVASHPDYIGFWDADLATPLEAIPTFLELAEKNKDIEMVFGSRVKLLGRRIERRPLRHYLGRVFATVVAITLGISIYDSQCGAKIFRVSRSIVDLFREPFISRWIFDVEIIARLIKARRSTKLLQADQIIHEIPLQEWRDVRGSKIRGADFIRAMFDIVQIYNGYLRTSPMSHET